MMHSMTKNFREGHKRSYSEHLALTATKLIANKGDRAPKVADLKKREANLRASGMVAAANALRREIQFQERNTK